MDSVIRNILDLDQKTAALAQETKDTLAQNEQQLQALIESQESERKEEARKESDAQFHAVIAEAEQQVANRKQDNERKLARMQERYQSRKDALAQAVLDQLLED